MGEAGGGHMSPIAGYDATSDRVLLADVSRYKFAPVWVTVQDLYNAMNTTDGSALRHGRSRGWIEMHLPPSSPQSAGSETGSSDGDAATPAPPPFDRARYTQLRSRISGLPANDGGSGVIACFKNPERLPYGVSTACGSEAPDAATSPAAIGVAAAMGTAVVIGALVGFCVARRRSPRKTGYKSMPMEPKDCE